MKIPLGNKGFTLVELLIVIAIIGILSSVVLANVSQGRTKAYDAKVQAQMASIRGDAEIYYITNGNYGITTYSCGLGMFADTASGMVNLTKSVNYPVGENTIVCNSDSVTKTYAVSDNMSGTSTYWCIDSKGTSKQESTSLANSTVCA
ncbi:MAG: type II secretion system protein [bacterium]